MGGYLMPMRSELEVTNCDLQFSNSFWSSGVTPLFPALADCCLLVADCPLPTAHCSLLTAYCLLLTTYCLLQFPFPLFPCSPLPVPSSRATERKCSRSVPCLGSCIGDSPHKRHAPHRQIADPRRVGVFECCILRTAQLINCDFGISLWLIILFRVPLAISKWLGMGIVIPRPSN
jgi:hypothetical protein